ncbi:MAG: hypothetical protein VW298_02205 [Candidatus Woesearchaeota archaeon]
MWEKKGLIFSPNTNNYWSKSHSQVPTVDVLSEKIWRIYYSSRDSENRSHISYFDVEAHNPSNILYLKKEPILNLGKLGSFDDSGLMPSSIVSIGNLRYLYYTGWSVRKTIPYHNAIGIAVSYDNGETYSRLFDGPVLSTNAQEPYFVGTSFVLKENELWRNWYSVCTGWEEIQGKAEPYYHIKYAESQDGVNWLRNGQVAIDYQKDEAGIVRATVIKDELYKMWFCYRHSYNYRTDWSKSYRIGFAYSRDGVCWQRNDNLSGINISDSGWDSEMIAYPDVIFIDNKKYMFYNGNGFGRSGIGYAIWKD